jgi:8-oxo-dGTP diphosphatase
MTTEAHDAHGPPPRVTRVAAYALCTDAEAVLLCRIAPGWTADADGMWTLPGGGLDFGETPADGALRELTEETGLVGEITELAGVDARTGNYTDPRDGVTRSFHSVRILYRMRIIGGRLRDELGGSTDTCRWVPRSELRSLPIVDLVEVAMPLAFPGSPHG